MEMNQFVAVTDDPAFCLGTTLLYTDTCNNVHVAFETFLSRTQKKEILNEVSELGNKFLEFCN